MNVKNGRSRTNAMWLLIPSTTSLISNRVFASSKMLTILTLIVLAILSESETLNVPQNESTVSRVSDSQQNAIKDNSADTKLLEKYNQFVNKYAYTLMNSTFLPFVDGCKAVMEPSKPVSKPEVKDRFLCLTYFDMIYNLNATIDKNYTLTDKVNTFLNDYDNATLVKNFCEFFGGELPTEDTKRPFVSTFLANHSIWIDATQAQDSCKLLCYYLDGPTKQRISPICKLISGGYRLIKQYLVGAKIVPKPDASAGDAILPHAKIAPDISASVVDKQIKVEPVSSKVNAQTAAATVVNVTQSTTTVKNELQAPINSAGVNSIGSKPSEEAKKKTSPMANLPPDAAEPAPAHGSKDEKVNAHNEETKPVVDINQEVEDNNDENGDVLGKNNKIIDSKQSNSLSILFSYFMQKTTKAITMALKI